MCDELDKTKAYKLSQGLRELDCSQTTSPLLPHIGQETLMPVLHACPNGVSSFAEHSHCGCIRLWGRIPGSGARFQRRLQAVVHQELLGGRPLLAPVLLHSKENCGMDSCCTSGSASNARRGCAASEGSRTHQAEV